MAAREYPIEDYAIIGNCETAALVNSDGGIDWLCLPAFDSPSFFGALIDRQKGGEFAIRPSGQYQRAREYLADTAILQTRFTCDRSVVRLTDFFVIARKRHARFYDFTSLYPTHKLVRLLKLEEGDKVQMELRLAARPDYAREPAVWKPRANGFECAQASVVSNISLELKNDDIVGRVIVESGKRYFCVLDYDENPATPDARTIRRWFEITKAFWEEWNLFNYYRGPHRKVVRRSAVTLKLLTYAPTGAFVAAPTTSLPEKIGGEANWDYRFTWVRDTSLFINTLFRIGYSGEAKAYLNFICKKFSAPPAETTDQLPALLPIRDETSVEEEILDHLAGYRDSHPVRRGNRAANQLQLDNYGHLLQSLFFWKQTGGKIDPAKRRVALSVLEQASQRWREPDHGVWEKTETQHHTSGKVGVWLALQRGRDLGLIEPGHAEEICSKIRQDILAHGVRQEYGAHYLANTYDDQRIDCSALLAFTTGFLSDDIARSTRSRIEQHLAQSPWLYRSEFFRARGEGAFVLCSFWWIDHLIREGEILHAENLLEQVIAHANPLGLYSEEIDPASGKFLGNFPQAFSHLGLIAALLNLQESKRDPRFAALPDHEKFCQIVGTTVGPRGVIAGFFRVPKTFRLLFSRRSKWKS